MAMEAVEGINQTIMTNTQCRLRRWRSAPKERAPPSRGRHARATRFASPPRGLHSPNQTASAERLPRNRNTRLTTSEIPAAKTAPASRREPARSYNCSTYASMRRPATAVSGKAKVNHCKRIVGIICVKVARPDNCRHSGLGSVSYRCFGIMLRIFLRSRRRPWKGSVQIQAERSIAGQDN